MYPEFSNKPHALGLHFCSWVAIHDTLHLFLKTTLADPGQVGQPDALNYIIDIV